MNFSILKSFQGKLNGLVKRIAFPKMLQISETRGIHHLCSPCLPALSSQKFQNYQNIFKPMNFLTPILPQIIQNCGMKQRGQLQLRCKGCYYVTRQERLYVMCKLKPRHKQMQIVKAFRDRRILTFAYQKKQRDW